GLGQGTPTEELRATQVGSASNWLVVSSSATHGCGVRTDGTLWCWGEPDAGSTHFSTPTQIGTATGWLDVATGRSFTCALKSPGSLWCWGLNDEGQLGDGTSTNRT